MATATMSTVQCCKTGGAPLSGTQFWVCPTCKTKWNIAGFEDMGYGETWTLEPVLECCDGLGYTGNMSERCAEHYEPLDSIWFTR